MSARRGFVVVLEQEQYPITILQDTLPSSFLEFLNAELSSFGYHLHQSKTDEKAICVIFLPYLKESEKERVLLTAQQYKRAIVIGDQHSGEYSKHFLFCQTATKQIQPTKENAKTIAEGIVHCIEHGKTAAVELSELPAEEHLQTAERKTVTEEKKTAPIEEKQANQHELRQPPSQTLQHMPIERVILPKKEVITSTKKLQDFEKPVENKSIQHESGVAIPPAASVRIPRREPIRYTTTSQEKAKTEEKNSESLSFLSNLYEKNSVQDGVKQERTTSKNSHKIKLSHANNKMMKVFGIVVVLLLLFGAWVGLYSYATSALLSSTSLVLQQGGDGQKSSSESQSENQIGVRNQKNLLAWRVAQQFLHLPQDVISAVGISANSEEYSLLQRVSFQAISLQEEDLRHQQSLQALYGFIVQDEQQSKQLTELLETEQAHITRRIQQLGDVILERQRTSLYNLSENLQQLLSGDSRTKLSLERKNAIESEHIAGILPKLLGEDSRLTYALVFQNSAELRPMGGLITTVAFVSFEKGRLLDIEIKDVTELDAQMFGKVRVVPEEIQKYLGEEQWLLRDSNWSPDAKTSAKQIAWFLEKQTDTKIHGVVFLTPQAIQDILRVTGALKIEGDDSPVDAQNLQERLEKRVNLSGENTVSSSEEYLTLIARSLSEQLKTLPAEKRVLLLTSLHRSFQQHTIALWTKDPDTKKSIDLLSWSGDIMKPPCPQPFSEGACTVDTLFSVETNVGINRVNGKIQRMSPHNVVMKENTIQHTLTVRLTNTAPSNAWPYGSYRLYYRLYVPEGAQFRTITINGTPLSEETLYIASEGTFTYVGVPVEVPVSETITLSISYEQPLPKEKSFTYALFVQKQLGIEEYPLTVNIDAGAKHQVSLVAPTANINGKIVQFDQQIDNNTYLAVELVSSE
jgi:hypothetical protein